MISVYAQIKVPELPNPGRLYLHKAGLNLYGINPITAGKEDFKRARELLAGQGKNYPWVIGILWGDQEERVTDFFMYSGIDSDSDWGKNPEMSYAQFRSGVYVEKPEIITCGDGLIILGKEEEHRRKSIGIRDYLQISPLFHYKDITFRL